MQKFLIQVIALVLVILATSIFLFREGGNYSLTGLITTPPAQKLQIGSSTINVEIADTPDKRTKGLSDREKLASDSGMLFVFDKVDKYRFWMKGMRFALDFIWIKDDTVVDLLPNVPAPMSGQSDDSLPVYEPITYVNKVVEVNSGFIATQGIKVGDNVQLMQ